MLSFLSAWIIQINRVDLVVVLLAFDIHILVVLSFLVLMLKIRKVFSKPKIARFKKNVFIIKRIKRFSVFHYIVISSVAVVGSFHVFFAHLSEYIHVYSLK